MPDATEAIIDLLRRIDPGENPVGLYQIGIPLVVESKHKFTEEQVLNGLMSLQSRKLIEITDENSLRLLKPLPEASDAIEGRD
ncbi:hypothetical protein LP421_10535 [Rhizobium sp. RCAM05350]|nr:hypothetical protein LP421_10535 [Rhizobium sp. RCAM05350]